MAAHFHIQSMKIRRAMGIYSSQNRWLCPLHCPSQKFLQSANIISVLFGYRFMKTFFNINVLETKQVNNSVPVRNLDSSSVNISPSEYAPNLALVYLRTRSGPKGPRPLHYGKER